MARTVVLPKLGNTVEVCIVSRWLVGVGQLVKVGEPVCEVETDKTTVEVVADAEGVVLAQLAAAGDEVAVLSPFYVVGEAGEELPDDSATVETGAGSAAAFTAEAGAARSDQALTAPALSPAESPVAGAVKTDELLHFSPRARTVAHEKGLPLAAVSQGTGPFGIAIARDVEAVFSAGPGLTKAAAASPDAVTYRPGMTGSGIGGRLTLDDLGADTERRPETKIESPRAGEPIPTQADLDYTETPIRGIRKLIAERMVESLASAAQVSYQTSAPAAALLDLRARLKSSAPEVGLAQITVGDLVAFAAARVAARHPAINAHLVDGVLRSFKVVHLGLAVDTTRGLMVPTIADASSLSLKEFSIRSKALAADCQAGSISPDQLSGGTFTVSNLGAFGIEGCTPVVNLPQTAILGVGTIVPRARAEADGTVGIEDRLTLFLTADHRVIDGADAARYLQDLVAAIANIDTTVLS